MSEKEGHLDNMRCSKEDLLCFFTFSTWNSELW